MVDIALWMKDFLRALDERFGERVWFVGLQGSYGRGEATENSDIDTVVILDRLTVTDIDAYNTMLDSLPHRELICGFLSGKDEILNWDGGDLFQFYHDTKAIKGTLDRLLPLLDTEKAIKMGACNIYHGCLHNMLHEKSDDILIGLYKSAYFLLQAVCYKDTGRYIGRMEELAEALSEEYRAILDTYRTLKAGGKVDLQPMSEALFNFAKGLIK